MDEEELRVNELINAYREDDVEKINSMKGVNLDYQDQFGRTPLMNAIINQEEALARKLIYAGVNLDLQDCQGSTAINELIGIEGVEWTKSGLYNITNLLFEMAQLGRVNLNIQDIKGDTPLMEAIFFKNNILIKRLIDSGVDLNIKNTNGNTALFKMIYSGDRENAKTVLNKPSVDLNHKDNHGITALMASIIVERMDDDKSRELTVLLLDKGVEINAQDFNDWSALMYACRGAKFETSKMLIERGADYNLKNLEGKSARDIAYKAENGVGQITSLIESIELTKLCDQEEAPMLSLGQAATSIIVKRQKSLAELEHELLMDMCL